MKRRYNTPKSAWPQKEVIKKVIPSQEKIEHPIEQPIEQPVVPPIEPVIKPLTTPIINYLMVNDETRLFWTLGLVTIGILILITLSLLIATIQNARLLSLLISKK